MDFYDNFMDQDEFGIDRNVVIFPPFWNPWFPPRPPFWWLFPPGPGPRPPFPPGPGPRPPFPPGPGPRPPFPPGPREY